MNKRAQLMQLEFHYFMIGFFVGLISSLTLIFLGERSVIPFKIPAVCGATMLFGKKGQLGIIEFKYFMFGFFTGLILGLVLVGLGTAGVLPFKIPLVCKAVVAQ